MAHFAVPKSKGNPLDDFATNKYNSDEDEDFDISEEELTSSDYETEPETDCTTQQDFSSEITYHLAYFGMLNSNLQSEFL